MSVPSLPLVTSPLLPNEQVSFQGPYSVLPPSMLGGITLEKMAMFLSEPENYTITMRIFHPKLVQRSYGKEKRFFCPPPLIYFKGKGWQRNDVAVQETLERYRVAVSSFQYAHNAPQLPNLPLRYHVALGNGDGTHQIVMLLDSKQYCAGRSLFISSTDKRKQFRICIDVSSYIGPSTLYPAQMLGTFFSSEVRVVSKPPKKQSTRSLESSSVCIKSGMIVALYNRIKSHSISTRYLRTQGMSFIGSNDVWSAYYIFAVDKLQNSPMATSFVMDEGYIHYGDIVRLVDALSGVSSPNMVIRRIDKDEILLETSNDPVAQLQKVAFQLCDSLNVYWSMVMSQVMQKEALIIMDNVHKVEDFHSWSVAQADIIDYKYFEANGPSSSAIVPIPIVQHVTLDGTSETNAVVELSGVDLGKRLTVWFGLVPADTIEATRGFIQCKVPLISAINKHHQPKGNCEIYGTSICVPLTLVRDDGVIYPTSAKFMYSCNVAGTVGHVVSTDLATERRNEFGKNMLELNRTRYLIEDQVRSEVSNALRKRTYESN